MRFVLKHPTNETERAEYGFDFMCGFFVDIFDGENVVMSYDVFDDDYNTRRPLMGAPS